MKLPIISLLIICLLTSFGSNDVAGQERMPAGITIRASEEHAVVSGNSCSIAYEGTGFAARFAVAAEDGSPTYFSRALSAGVIVQEGSEVFCEVSFTFDLPREPTYLITIGGRFEKIVGQAQIHATAGLVLSYEPEAFVVPSPTPTAEPTPDVTNDVPDLPTATAAWRAGAIPASSENYLDEPLLMIFDVYGFASPDEAKAQLEPLSDWYVEHQSILLETPISEFTEVSLGPLGDDRRAFLREAYGEDPPYLLAVIQVGPNILVVDALSYGGDITAFVGDYLDAFLAGATDDPLSLVPDVSDLPRGWALVRGSPMDRLPEVKKTAATPAS